MFVPRENYWSRVGATVCLLTSIVVCAFLSCSNDTQDVKLKPEPKKEVQRKLHLIIVSGFQSDPTKAQIEGKAFRGSGNSGMFQLAGDLKEKGFDCSFYNWNGTKAGNLDAKDAPGPKQIATDMSELAAKDSNLDFVLIGHSWGGHSICEVAGLLEQDNNVTISKVFLIDPSSAMRGKLKALPTKISTMDNYFTANSFCWGEWKDEPRVNNISLADPKNGFVVDGHPNYAGMFDWNAHTASEWDQKIHAEICSKIEVIKTAAAQPNQSHSPSQ